MFQAIQKLPLKTFSLQEDIICCLKWKQYLLALDSWMMAFKFAFLRPGRKERRTARDKEDGPDTELKLMRKWGGTWQAHKEHTILASRENIYLSHKVPSKPQFTCIGRYDSSKKCVGSSVTKCATALTAGHHPLSLSISCHWICTINTEQRLWRA